jgi:hypothetical protein
LPFLNQIESHASYSPFQLLAQSSVNDNQGQ